MFFGTVIGIIGCFAQQYLYCVGRSISDKYLWHVTGFLSLCPCNGMCRYVHDDEYNSFYDAIEIVVFIVILTFMYVLGQAEERRSETQAIERGIDC